jgi:predicted O-methyltransferase YrrM
VHVLHRLAACFRLSGRAETAIRLELEAAERFPHSAETAAGLVESYAAVGRWDDVEAWAARLLESPPEASRFVERPLEVDVLPFLRRVQGRLERGDAAGAVEGFRELAESRAIAALEETYVRFRDALDGGREADAARIVREVSGRFDLDLKALARGLFLDQDPMDAREPAARESRGEVVARLTTALSLPGSLVEEIGRVRVELDDAYHEYIRHVSAAEHALSLETSALLLALCRLARPLRTLDLGSGFSSYVLRVYASATNGVEVVSVDDAVSWLMRTRAFLESAGLREGHLLTWDAFSTTTHGRFDLVLHDLGDFATRRRSLPVALDAVRPGGLIVVDDADRAVYSSFVRQALEERRFELFDMSGWTVDAIRRFSWVARSPLDAEQP